MPFVSLGLLYTHFPFVTHIHTLPLGLHTHHAILCVLQLSLVATTCAHLPTHSHPMKHLFCRCWLFSPVTSLRARLRYLFHGYGLLRCHFAFLLSLPFLFCAHYTATSYRPPMVGVTVSLTVKGSVTPGSFSHLYAYSTLTRLEHHPSTAL